MKRSFDETESSRLKPVDQFAGTMFSVNHEGAAARDLEPRIRESAPSVRSASSEDASDALTPSQLADECRRVYTWYKAQSEPRTRHECAAVLYVGPDGITNLGSACGRINALVGTGWLREVGKQGKRATLRVTTAEERWHFLRHSSYPEVAA